MLKSKKIILAAIAATGGTIVAVGGATTYLVLSNKQNGEQGQQSNPNTNSETNPETNPENKPDTSPTPNPETKPDNTPQTGPKTDPNTLESKIQSITKLSLKENSSIQKLASAITSEDLKDISKFSVKAGENDFQVPSDAQLSLELISGNNQVNDDAGTLEVNLKLTKGSETQSKKVKLEGLKPKLSTLEESKFSVDVTEKGKISPSQLTNEMKKLKVEGLDVDNKYDVKFEKVWVNDVEAKAKIKATISLKENPSIKRDLSLEVTGFARVNLNHAANIRWKNLSTHLKAPEFRNQILNSENKLQELRKYFDLSIPQNAKLEVVKIDLETFKLKNQFNYQLVLHYKIVRDNLDNGSDENPSSKTGKVESIQFSQYLVGFSRN
ncbi:unknown; predicted coding region [Mycoplasmopsis pulmonis]|uniref:Lipoprotein-associated type-17 domain-containing protein n=1 Tax=Mycoplasmopsis pulmonis (strain UAB CTIP) TaxID=272635 RepID=Q98QV9_MYCPU|nr:lipoprotein 17-related variable surface protein [Mycoplasmopsis pulmonis]CAC13424.1 unknown; predicted coding region [Mycoplasmopsis pulmonis]